MDKTTTAVTSDRRTLRNRPVDRLQNAVIYASTAADAGSMFSEAQWQEIDASGELPAMVKALEQAEAATRRLRLQLETRLAGQPARACAVCGGQFYGRADRRFCSDSCRQSAHRRKTKTPA